MKHLLPICIAAISFASCSSPKAYFSTTIRTKLENSNVPISKVQFYIDRDVEIRREVESSTTQVTAGKIKFENGKYVNIITLKKGTPGICTMTHPGKIDVSFDSGDNKYLTFGQLKKEDNNAPYTLYANSWLNDLGEIKYDGRQYYILPAGSEARLMIKKSVLSTAKVEKSEMGGRKVK